MRTNISKKILALIMFFSAMLMLVFLVFCAKPVNVFAETNPEKTYHYTISSTNGYITVTSAFNDGTSHLLVQGQTLDGAIKAINLDRFTSQTHHDATLIFNNVVVGDNYLQLKYGNYTIKGTLTGRGYSTFGLISLPTRLQSWWAGFI